MTPISTIYFGVALSESKGFSRVVIELETAKQLDSGNAAI